MLGTSLGLTAPYRLKRWIALLAQASLRLDFTKGSPLDSRVTFTRASGGTSFRPVSFGADMFGSFSGGTTNTGSSIVGGALVMSAAPGGYAVFVDSRPFQANRLYKFDVSYAGVTGNCVVLFQGVGASIAFSGTGTSTYTIDSGSIANARVQINNNSGAPVSGTVSLQVQEITLDRPGDPIQLFTAPANVPRFDYDPATGAAKGLLIEEQRVNGLKYSETLSVVDVAKDGVTNSGATVTATAGNAQHRVYQQSQSASGAGVATVDVKAGTHRYIQLYDGASINNFATFDLVSGVVGAVGANTVAKIASLGGSAFRCSCSYSSAQAPNGNVFVGLAATAADTWGASFNAVGSESFELYRMQFEPNASFPTSYIPTNGASATRAADIANINTLTPWFSGQSGTLFAEFDGLSVGGKVAQFNPVAVGSFLTLASGNGATNGWYNNGLSVLGINAVGLNNKSAIAYSPSGGAAGCINGGAVASSSASDFTGAATSVAIGSQATGQFLNGHIRRLAYFSLRLSNLDLQGLTR